MDGLLTASDFIEQFTNRQDVRNGRPMNAGASTPATVEQLWRSGLASCAELAEGLSQYCGLERVTYDEVAPYPLANNLSMRYLRDAFVYPYERDGEVTVALANPLRADVIKAMTLAMGLRPTLRIASFEDIELLLERVKKDAAIRPNAVGINESEDLGVSETEQSLQDLARGAPVVRLIDEILERAIGVGATDVHLETEREQLQVRMRVDGYLRRDQRLPLSVAPAVISRLKIIAGLDISDRRLPQDGRANLKIGNVEADLRVAVMPTMYGETAVLRILLRDTRLLDLGRIGMQPADQVVFGQLLAEPHGVVVVTGPTGSGKTTTLATAISMLNDPSRKIVTVEDPIEYQIAGVHQTQIKPAIGLTFATALRSFLRHDPDIIMVGEMRDGETASIGIQAALTGHLVLTTLHTNSASDAVIRLMDIGVEPYLLASSLRGVLGQRLVRKLCERCKMPDDAAERTVDRLSESRGLSSAGRTTFYRAGACEACGHTGYRGRIGIFEVMRVDESLRDLLRQDPDPQAISGMARKAGMTLMSEDGLRKCGQGLTTIDEVLRATG